jgi:DNA-binding response OmpR family regulator
MEAGFDDYLVKPIDLSVILETIKRASERRRGGSQWLNHR